MISGFRQRSRVGGTEARLGRDRRSTCPPPTSAARSRVNSSNLNVLVADMAATFADRVGEIRLSATEFPHQPLVGLGLFERRQILTLQIFDKRDFHRLGVGEDADKHRHPMQSGALRRVNARSSSDLVGTPRLPLRRGVHAALVARPSSVLIAFNASNSASSKRRRGWNAPGRISSIATSRTAPVFCPVAAGLLC